MSNINHSAQSSNIETILSNRILILDGALGTELLKNIGNSTNPDFFLPDILTISDPDLLRNVHLEYLKSGADIIETNTFNANRFSLSNCGLDNEVYRLNFSAAKIAKEAINKYNALDKPRFLAGAIGPTNKLLYKDYSQSNFESFTSAYYEQIRALADGGVDFLLIETIIDSAAARAAIYAANKYNSQSKTILPIALSISPNRNGQLLSGESIHEFYRQIENETNIFAFGINCAFGAESIGTYLESISAFSRFFTIAFPSAGIPDSNGNYQQSPQEFAEILAKYAQGSLIDIIGGCCGASYKHIIEISKYIS